MNEAIPLDSTLSGTSRSILQLDIGNDPQTSLAAFAGRIEALLAIIANPLDPNVLGPLDDLLGAIYSFILAAFYGFEDRPDREIQAEVISARAEQLKRGSVRLDGAWIAGWHFNSALFRVAAVYHRLLKVVTGNAEGDRYTLQHRAEELFHSWTGLVWSNRNAVAIYRETNALKHDARGVYYGRKVTFNQGVAAVDEVLTLVEAWRAKS